MNLIGITYNQTPSDPLSITAIIVAVITAIWSLISYIIRKNIDKKCQEQIETIKTQNQKELAEYKSELTKQIDIFKIKNKNITYITKTQFDAEFKMYQELSEPIFDMFFGVLKLFPMGLDYVPEDEIERKKFYEKRYNNAMDNLLVFQKKLYVYAPFIPKHIYDMFDNFRVEARKQVNWYPDFILYPDKEIVHELREEKRKCWKRTEELQKQYNDIIDKLRNYLQSLKVMDGNNE